MKNCIMLWKNDAVDLAINNQRRAFSDAYNNEVPAESKIYIELSSKNPLSKLSSLETEHLINPAFLSSTRPDSSIPIEFFTLLISNCCQNDIYQNRHHTVHRIGC